MPKRDTELYTTPRRSPRLLQNEASKESEESSRISRRRIASKDHGDRKPLKDYPKKSIKCCSEKVSKKKPRKAIEVSEVRGNLSAGSRYSRVSRDGTQKLRRSPRIADLCEELFVGERKGSKESGNHRSSKSPRSVELIEGCQTRRRSTRVLTKLGEESPSEDRSGVVKAQKFVSVDSKAVIQKSREKVTKVIGNFRSSNSRPAKPSKTTVLIEGCQTTRRSTRVLTKLCQKTLHEDRSGIVTAQSFMTQRSDLQGSNSGPAKPSRTSEMLEGFQTPRRSTTVLTQLSEKTLQEDRLVIMKEQNYNSVHSKALVVTKVSGNHRSLNSGQVKPSGASEIIEGFQMARRSTKLVAQLSEILSKDYSGNVKAQNFVAQRSKRKISRKDGEEKSRAVEVSRKRKQGEFEESHEAVHGWTKEQEFALQKAYLIAKPTPQFWKEVSRLVPGKSAQDCFDKLNSDYVTPPQRRRDSKVTKDNHRSQISVSEVLRLANKPKQRKKPIHILRKNARHLLLEQHHQASSEADLFSVLEPNLNFEVSTPKQMGSLRKKLTEISSSSSSTGGHKNPCSRFSPPVLKMVKDKALHEKYIDQLHVREARRKTASLRAKKFSANDDGDQTSRDLVRAAKNALVSEARGAIDALRRVRSDGMSDNSSDLECDFRGDESGTEI